MKKFTFNAVDTSGRILRGVLRASGEEEARLLLLENQVHPKQLEEAPEDAEVTWAPKPVRKEDDPASHFYKGSGALESPVRMVFPTRLLDKNIPGPAGSAGLTRSGGFAFQSEENEAASITIDAGEIEIARIEGFFPRVLRIFRLNGRMVEFSVGKLFAHSAAKETMRALNKRQ